VHVSGGGIGKGVDNDCDRLKKKKCESSRLFEKKGDSEMNQGGHATRRNSPEETAIKAYELWTQITHEKRSGRRSILLMGSGRIEIRRLNPEKNCGR